MDIDDFWVMFNERFPHCAELKETLLRIQQTGAERQQCNFIISGNPGCGKATVCEQVIGPFLYCIGILRSKEVIHSSTTLLSYIEDHDCLTGSTTTIIQQLFADAQGHAVVIDDLSVLTDDDTIELFAGEAIEALHTALDNGDGRFAIIIADHGHHVESFLALDQSIAEKFSHHVSLPGI